MLYTARPDIWERVSSTMRRWWHDPSNHNPVMIFLEMRVLTLVVAFMALSFGRVYNPYSGDYIYKLSTQTRNYNSPLSVVIEPWHRWDTGWYLKIAQFGYEAHDGSIIFAPLYPALIAVVGGLLGDKLLGALVVSSISCLIFLMCFYKLTRQEFNNVTGSNALLAVVTFPTAFYLLAGYTEAPYLAFTVGAFLAATNRRWWIAAILAALATLTRLQGWLLFIPFTWMAFVETPRFWMPDGISFAGMNWFHRIRCMVSLLLRPSVLIQSIPRLAAIGSGPLMVLAYYSLVEAAGLGSVGTAYDKFWALQVRVPWASVIDVFSRIFSGKASATEFGGVASLIVIVALGLASFRVLPVRYHLYLWPTLAFVLLRYYSQTLLNGTMRYVLDFFPIFITAAIYLLSNPRIRFGWVVTGVTLQLFMLFLFARWMWIA